MKTKSGLMALLIGVAPLTFASLIFDDFAENFDNFTDQTHMLEGVNLEWSAENGVGGVSGRINPGSEGGDHGNAVYYSGDGAAITWEEDTPYAASIFFLPGTISSDISHVFSGFIRSTGSNFGGGGSGVWGRMRNDSSGTYLTLYQQNSVVGSNIAAFDNFTVIPEPGTAALMALAFGTLALFRRRR